MPTFRKPGQPRKRRIFARLSIHRDPDTFVGWVNVYRHAHDLPVEVIARRMNMSASFVFNLLVGKKRITPRVTDALAKAFALEDEERKHLHRLAARHEGFDV